MDSSDPLVQRVMFDTSGRIIDSGPCQNCGKDAYTRYITDGQAVGKYQTYHRETRNKVCGVKPADRRVSHMSASVSGYHCGGCQIYYADENERDGCEYGHVS